MSYVLHFCYNVFFEPFIKIVLGTDSRGAGRSFFEYVLQFVVYPTGFLVVSELDMEHFDQTGAQVGVEDGGDGFDTAIRLRVQSSAGNKHFSVTTESKRIRVNSANHD